MTQNQIAYWNYQETKRSNQAREGENKRHNINAETETNRHNLASESIDLSSLYETNRANLAKEKENTRANQARERETHRSNLVNEGLSRANLAELSTQNAATREKMKYENILSTANANRANREADLADIRTTKEYVDLGFAPAALVTKYSQAIQHSKGTASRLIKGLSSAGVAATAAKKIKNVGNVIKSGGPISSILAWNWSLSNNSVKPSGTQTIDQ